MVKLSEINVNPDNPRLIKDEKFKQLCENIKAMPNALKLRPIVVDTQGMILGGNYRYHALLRLGYTEVPDEWIKTADDFTPEQIKRFIITDNVGYGEWDWDIIQNEWNVEELQGWGLDIPDFSAPADEADPFDDDGIANKNQYGVIVLCTDESAQEKVFNELTNKGLNCKIVVT